MMSSGFGAARAFTYLTSFTSFTSPLAAAAAAAAAVEWERWWERPVRVWPFYAASEFTAQSVKGITETATQNQITKDRI